MKRLWSRVALGFVAFALFSFVAQSCVGTKSAKGSLCQEEVDGCWGGLKCVNGFCGGPPQWYNDSERPHDSKVDAGPKDTTKENNNTEIGKDTGRGCNGEPPPGTAGECSDKSQCVGALNFCYFVIKPRWGFCGCKATSCAQGLDCVNIPVKILGGDFGGKLCLKSCVAGGCDSGYDCCEELKQADNGTVYKLDTPICFPKNSCTARCSKIK